MSRTAYGTFPGTPVQPRPTRRVVTTNGNSPLLIGTLCCGGLATAVAAVLSNGDLIIAITPLVISAVLGLMWTKPISVSLLTLIFLGLALDHIGPLAPVGTLLFVNLNKTIPMDVLAVPGAYIILVFLLCIHVCRSSWGLPLDRIGRTPVPAVLLQGITISVVSAFTLCLLGFQLGGDLQMAKIQVQTFVMLLVVAYLAAVSLRGPKDYQLLGRLVVIAACVRAGLALYVVNTTVLPEGELGVATSHGDSLLFATATLLLIVRFAEAPTRWNAFMGFIVLPLLVAGMVANNRRIVWVEIAAPLITYWLISRPSKIKRLFLRGLLVASPLVLLYIGAGWNSGADFFAPVRTVRSLGDGEVNASTLYRDLENYNLIATIREEPIIGTGFGHPFVEVVKLPDISFFREYLYMPHNSILGLYAFCGPIGFTGLTMVIVIGVYLAAIGYRRAQTSDERIASFMAIAGAIIFLEHCWGDIGFSERRTMLIFGPLLAIAGQVAVSTGAWRKSSSRVRPNAAMRA